MKIQSNPLQVFYGSKYADNTYVCVRARVYTCVHSAIVSKVVNYRRILPEESRDIAAVRLCKHKANPTSGNYNQASWPFADYKNCKSTTTTAADRRQRR